MWSSIVRRISVFFLFTVSALFVPLASTAADTTWRSGHPPTIVSAQLDEKRQLVVVFNASDGMTYGGFVLIDADPSNAVPASVNPVFGPIMPCNNKGTCTGTWSMPAGTGSGPFTYTSPPLSSEKFPDGTYYLQVDTWNEDPYPSTRQEEFSAITLITLKTTSTPIGKVPLLTPVKLPVSNGTSVCIAWRDRLTIGNLLVAVHNDYNTRVNSGLAKVSKTTPEVNAIVKRALKQNAVAQSSLALVLSRAKSACSKSPEITATKGAFIPIPVPESNGTAACIKSRNHIVYVNQELLKYANNRRTTTSGQTVRIKQLEKRFNQLTTDLKKSWPAAFQACNPL